MFAAKEVTLSANTHLKQMCLLTYSQMSVFPMEGQKRSMKQPELVETIDRRMDAVYHHLTASSSSSYNKLLLHWKKQLPGLWFYVL